MTGLKVPAILFMLALTSLALNNAWARSGSSGTGSSSSSTSSSDRDTRANTQDMSATPGTAADTTAAERAANTSETTTTTTRETTTGAAAAKATPSGGRVTTTGPSAAIAANDRAVVIRFDKGQSALTQNDMNKLKTLISSLGADNIERIEVAAWSDKTFPRTGSDLPKPDRDLADQRASRIHDFLKSQANVSGTRIKSFNMAETSNWLARTMRTEDAELKSVFAKEGTTPVHRADFDYIVKEGAPSEAVVVVVRK